MRRLRSPAPHAGARFVLLSGLLLGAAKLAWMATARPSTLGANFRVYDLAARAALDGGDVYAVSPDGFAFTYVYPPVTVIGFLPFAGLGDWPAGFAVHLAGTLLAGGALGWLVVRTVASAGVALSTLDRVLVGGFVVGSVHSVPSAFYGNVNVHLALGVGFLALERDREAVAGSALALAALVKAFPAALGVWLLRRRAWRAVGAAVVTGLAALALGVAVLGVDAHAAYATEALLPRLRTDVFAGGLDPDAPYVTVRRPLSVLFPGLPPALLSVAAFAVLAPVVGYVYAGDLDGPVDRLVAVHVTVSAVLLFVPSYFVYYALLYVPLVPLLYLLRGPGRRLFVAGATLANVAVLLGNVRAWLGPALAGTGLEPVVFAVLEPALTLGSPVGYGMALMLAGCVVRRVSGTPDGGRYNRLQK